MEIKSLSHSSLQEIVDCQLEAFSDYSEDFPSDLNYYTTRFRLARVDFAYSYGAFDSGKLVAFVLMGIDNPNGKWVAFNLATGVIPAFRGQKLVDRIFEHALPLLRQRGVEKCQLEVIPDNARAIRVYERIGFGRRRMLQSFQGERSNGAFGGNLREALFPEANRIFPSDHSQYAWEYTDSALALAGNRYRTFLVHGKAGAPVGYFCLGSQRGYVPRIVGSPESIPILANALWQLVDQAQVVSVDGGMHQHIAALKQAGFALSVEDLEMEMLL